MADKMAKGAEPTAIDFLLDAIDGPADELGKRLLWVCIREEAQQLGIPTCSIPDDFIQSYKEMVQASEAEAAEDAAFEKALHKAASGDFEAAGRLIREHLINGAVAEKFIPIGIEKSKQAKEFGDHGAALKRGIGRNNQQKIRSCTR
jgi:hypothetical protein